MSTFPTVVLIHPKKKDKANPSQPLRAIVNATDYKRDWQIWERRGFKLESVRGGNATKAQIADSIRESDIEAHRQRDPHEIKKRGDKARLAAERRLRVQGPKQKARAKAKALTEQEKAPNPFEGVAAPGTPATPPKEVEGEEKRPAIKRVVVPTTPTGSTGTKEAVDEDWKKLPWFTRRAYVGKLTGTLPDNAEQALELVAAYEAA